MIRIILYPVLLGLSLNLAAATFKWTDEDGRVHYGDKPSTEYESSQIHTGPKPASEKTEQKTTQPEENAPETKDQTVATETVDTPEQEPAEQDECEMIKAKFEKYKKGLIDFSTVNEKGEKITPSKVKVTKAYEDAIAEACG